MDLFLGKKKKKKTGNFAKREKLAVRSARTPVNSSEGETPQWEGRGGGIHLCAHARVCLGTYICVLCLR